MKIKDIVEMSTKIDGIHESCFRSYQILAYVEYLLNHDTPTIIVLDIIEELKSWPDRDVERATTGMTKESDL